MPEPIRRADDMRIEKIESTVDSLKEDISAIKVKIFNGFSHSIANTENKITYIDKQNKEDHQLVREDIRLLSGKFDKMLWALVSVSFLLIIGEVTRAML